MSDTEVRHCQWLGCMRGFCTAKCAPAITHNFSLLKYFTFSVMYTALDIRLSFLRAAVRA